MSTPQHTGVPPPHSSGPSHVIWSLAGQLAGAVSHAVLPPQPKSCSGAASIGRASLTPLPLPLPSPGGLLPDVPPPQAAAAATAAARIHFQPVAVRTVMHL